MSSVSSTPTSPELPPPVAPLPMPRAANIAPTMALRIRAAPKAASQPSTTLTQLVPRSAVWAIHFLLPTKRRTRLQAGPIYLTFGRFSGDLRSNLPGARLGVVVDFDLRSEEHTSELQSRQYLVCRLLLEKKQTS